MEFTKSTSHGKFTSTDWLSCKVQGVNKYMTIESLIQKFELIGENFFEIFHLATGKEFKGDITKSVSTAGIGFEVSNNVVQFIVGTTTDTSIIEDRRRKFGWEKIDEEEVSMNEAFQMGVQTIGVENETSTIESDILTVNFVKLNSVVWIFPTTLIAKEELCNMIEGRFLHSVLDGNIATCENDINGMTRIGFANISGIECESLQTAIQFYNNY